MVTCMLLNRLSSFFDGRMRKLKLSETAQLNREMLAGSRWIAIHICTVTQLGKQMLRNELLVKTCGDPGYRFPLELASVGRPFHVLGTSVSK